MKAVGPSSQAESQFKGSVYCNTSSTRPASQCTGSYDWWHINFLLGHCEPPFIVIASEAWQSRRAWDCFVVRRLTDFLAMTEEVSLRWAETPSEAKGRRRGNLRKVSSPLMGED